MISLSKKIVLLSSISMIILIMVLRTLSNISAMADPTAAQERWAVIEDVEGDRIRVETARDEIWAELIQLYLNGSKRWIGGIVEKYENEWGFRFNPETIIIAETTIEVWQTTIRGISENINYWIGNTAVVSAKVIEIYPSSSVGGVWVPIDKLSLLTPYIGLIFTITATTIAVYTKRKRETQSQSTIQNED